MPIVGAMVSVVLYLSHHLHARRLDHMFRHCTSLHGILRHLFLVGLYRCIPASPIVMVQDGIWWLQQEQPSSYCWCGAENRHLPKCAVFSHRPSPACPSAKRELLCGQWLDRSSAIIELCLHSPFAFGLDTVVFKGCFFYEKGGESPTDYIISKRSKEKEFTTN